MWFLQLQGFDPTVLMNKECLEYGVTSLKCFTPLRGAVSYRSGRVKAVPTSMDV